MTTCRHRRPNSPAEQELVARLTRAYETADVDGVVALLTDDVLLSMPPRHWSTGAANWRPVPHRGHLPGRPELPDDTQRGPTASPRSALYTRDPHAAVPHANGLLVLTLAGAQVSAITRFDNSVLPSFGLPRILPD